MFNIQKDPDTAFVKQSHIDTPVLIPFFRAVALQQYENREA